MSEGSELNDDGVLTKLAGDSEIRVDNRGLKLVLDFIERRDAARQEARERTIANIMPQVQSLVPLIASYVMRSDGGSAPPTIDPLRVHLNMLMSTLDPDQRERIMSALSATLRSEQAVILMSVFEEMDVPPPPPPPPPPSDESDPIGPKKAKR